MRTLIVLFVLFPMMVSAAGMWALSTPKKTGQATCSSVAFQFPGAAKDFCSHFASCKVELQHDKKGGKVFTATVDDGTRMFFDNYETCEAMRTAISSAPAKPPLK